MPELFTTIYTDGGCAPNPGEGAYVAILQNGSRAGAVRGYAPHATNQQMELAAAIGGLHALKTAKIPVKIFTDSQYLNDGASRWLKGWKRNKWRTSKDEPLKNVDLWQELDYLIGQYVISWHKVGGHAGVEMNVKADGLVWDTRMAKGDPTLYQSVEIPTLASPWNFTDFQTKTVRPEVAYLRQKFAGLLSPAGGDRQGDQ